MHHYTYPYLKSKGVSIFKDGKQILNDKGKIYPKNITEIQIGQDLVYENKKYSVTYDFLRDRGFIIGEKNIFGKKLYFLIKFNPKVNEVGEIPKNHTIRYNNSERSFKLEGTMVHPEYDSIVYTDDFIEEEKKEDFFENDLWRQSPIKKPEFFKIRLPVIGISLEGELVCFPKMDDAPVIALIGLRGMGKGLLEDEIIYTPKGQKKNKDLKVGDYICTQDGKSAEIKGIFPQGEREIYHIDFVDGTFIDCDDTHLWKIYQHNKKPEIIETKKLFNKIKKIKDKPWIEVTSPVQFKNKKIPIDPYMLGFLIGDGNLTHKTNLVFSTNDHDILRNFKSILDKGYRIVYKSGFDFSIAKTKTNSFVKNKYKEAINNLKLSIESSKRFIPKEYLFNTIEIRKELLKGLMDADGYVDGGMPHFATSSKKLSEDFRTLIESLGGIVRIGKKKRGYKHEGVWKRCKDSYVCKVNINNQKALFKLKRKINAVKERERYHPKRHIKSVEKLKKKQKTICIYIDSDEHLYLTKDFIVTHNTLLDHRLKDEFIEKDYALIIELNDMKQDCLTYCTEWEEGEFISDELNDIGEISKPMPMLYFTIVNDCLEEGHKLKYENEINFYCSLSMKDLLSDDKAFERFDLWKLKNSHKYFKQLIKEEDSGEIKEDGLLSKKKVSEMKNYVDDIGFIEQFPKNSCTMIKGILQNMWDTRIWDITNGINSKWEVEVEGERYETNPWVAGLIGGLSVSFNTGNWIEQEYAPYIYRYLLDSIYKEKVRIPFLRNKHIMISSDEIHYLTKHPEAVEIINEKNKVARSLGGGMIMVSQSSSDLISDIKDNVTHYAIFKQTKDDKEIKKELARYPNLLKQIPHLKNRECIITGDLVLIDPVTGKKYSNNNRPIQMRVLPPKSRHKAPPKGK